MFLVRELSQSRKQFRQRKHFETTSQFEAYRWPAYKHLPRSQGGPCFFCFLQFSKKKKSFLQQQHWLKKSLFVPGRNVCSTKTVFKKNITIAITWSKIVDAKTPSLQQIKNNLTLISFFCLPGNTGKNKRIGRFCTRKIYPSTYILNCKYNPQLFFLLWVLSDLFPFSLWSRECRWALSYLKYDVEEPDPKLKL